MENNEEIIKQLRAQEAVLIGRLKAVRNAIMGFGGEISNEELESLIELDDEPHVPKHIIVPESYSSELSQIEKIAYALKQLGGEAFITDIVDKIAGFEPAVTGQTEEEREKFKRNINLMASYLYRDGRLKAKRIGNKYKYKLIE